MPDTTTQSTPTNTPESRLKKLRRLPGPVQTSLLREALLAVPTCGDAEKASPYAWALLEMATLPGLKPSGPVWSPIRALAERKLRVADTAMSAVAATWNILNPDVRAAARGVGKDRWDGACRAALADRRAPVRRNAALALAEVGEGEVAPLVAELLQDHDTEVARTCERALVGMVVSARSTLWSEAEREAWEKAADEPSWKDVVRPRHWGWKDEALLSGAIADGLKSFDVHRKRGVLLGALLLCDRLYLRGVMRDKLTGVLEAVTSREHPAHGPLMSLLRARALPTGRLRALEWLAIPAARRAASARLARADGPLDHELVLAAAHLSLRPARRAALAAITAGGRTKAADAAPSSRPRVVLAPNAPLPTSAIAQTLSPQARRLAPLWARSIGATSPQRHAVIEGLLADPDALVRMACVRHAVSSLRMDQVLDVDERVSRAAYLAWVADAEARQEVGTDKEEAVRRAEHSRLLALFSRLPHPRVRALAAIDRAFDSDAFSRALPAASVAGMANAYRAFAADRAAFIDDLGKRLADNAAIGGGWSRVMHLVRRLGIAPDLEHYLRAIAGREGASADEVRNIAQAVTALGDVATPTSRAALETALAHADARVRANAVESLAKHARLTGTSPPAAVPVPTVLVELKADTHHRVRANAVRAALLTDIAQAPRREQVLFEAKSSTLGAGVESLAAMLSDDRSTHRLAGAWLAWKVLPAGGPLRLHERWPEMVARVAEVAQFDVEPKVRARAARCAQLVEASLAAASMHAPGTLALENGI